MKHIEKIKFWLGITLISFAILGGLVFFFESTSSFVKTGLSFKSLFETDKLAIKKVFLLIATNTPQFFGLCAIAGAWLLISVKKD
tara:strand:- start:1038 stop:1292 length:255 start_codon:yes stop_codon:yes gene_type:complete